MSVLRGEYVCVSDMEDGLNGREQWNISTVFHLCFHLSLSHLTYSYVIV